MNEKYILDRRREGAEFSLAVINRALRASGDLAPDRSERMEDEIYQEIIGDWDDQSKELVERYQARPRKEAWQGWSRYLDYRNEQATP